MYSNLFGFFFPQYYYYYYSVDAFGRETTNTRVNYYNVGKIQEKKTNLWVHIIMLPWLYSKMYLNNHRKHWKSMIHTIYDVHYDYGCLFSTDRIIIMITWTFFFSLWEVRFILLFLIFFFLFFIYRKILLL